MSEKINMGATFVGISEYTNENFALLAKAVYGAPTFASGVRIIPGQPGNTIKLPLISSDVYFQDKGCTWTNSGNTNFTQQSVTVCHIEVKESLCPDDFMPYWLGQLNNQNGETPSTIPFAQTVTQEKIASIAAEYEKLYWQGDIDGGTGNMVKCDGIYIKLSASTATYVAASSGATTAANVIAKLTAMVQALDERIAQKAGLCFYVPESVYTAYILAISALNHFNFYAQNTPAGVTIFEGFPNIEIRYTPGLRGTNYIILCEKSNLVWVTNLVGEMGELELLWDKEEKIIRFYAAAAIGAGIIQPELVVHNIPGI